MRTSLLIASVAAIASMSLPAFAYQDSDVAVAYADGYMGTDNQFHAWERRADAQDFRAHHADKYHPWRHDDPRHPAEAGK
jgi:hypothetical protein